MKKLGSVEKVEDFFLAVAGGADVNGTWRGSPLVEFFLPDRCRIASFIRQSIRGQRRMPTRESSKFSFSPVRMSVRFSHLHTNTMNTAILSD